MKKGSQHSVKQPMITPRVCVAFWFLPDGLLLEWRFDMPENAELRQLPKRFTLLLRRLLVLPPVDTFMNILLMRKQKKITKKRLLE